jgi:hypothetical protein
LTHWNPSVICCNVIYEAISSKQDEEEVLLMAGCIFILDKFEQNPETGDWDMQLSEGYN